jgi:hypothetical protein
MVSVKPMTADTRSLPQEPSTREATKDREKMAIGTVLKIAELQGKIPRKGLMKHQRHHGKQRAHKGEEDADAQGLAGLALSRQRTAVKGGGHGGGVRGFAAEWRR